MDLRLRSQQPAFFEAVRSGDVEAVRRVVDAAAEVGGGEAVAALMSSQTDAGETALYIAAEQNLEEVVRYLVRFCDFETAKVRSRLDMDAFQVAAKQGHVGIVKELLNVWPGLCKLCDSSNTSPLYSAAVKNHLDVVNAILVADESSMWIVRKNGKTSLHMAARNGFIEIVKALLEKDPGLVSVRDRKGQTALHMAVKGKNPDVVDELLHADPTILNVQDKKGNTALHIATRKWRPQKFKTRPIWLTRPNTAGWRRRDCEWRDDGRLVDGKTAEQSTQRSGGHGQLGRRAASDTVQGWAQAAQTRRVGRLGRDGRGKHRVNQRSAVNLFQMVYNSFGRVLNISDSQDIFFYPCPKQMVQLLLSYASMEVNAVNNQNEASLDLAEKIPYGESQLDIMESLTEAGAKNARNIGRIDEASELRRTVSDIKHDVQNQLIQNAKTNRRVSGIAKELKKLHREAVQNTINSVTLVATLVASIAFVAIFNLPGQYLQDGAEVGKAYIAGKTGFRVFCLLNATALFLSLAVVVVQITLVAWETDAQKQVVQVVNKVMWAACLSTGGSFLSIAFVVVGASSWMAVTVTLIGGPIMIGTLVMMSYLVLRQRFKIGEDSQRRIRRGSGSKSFSWSHHSAYSDPDALSDHEKKIYAL
ncbi:Ankyrin repeat-containing protein [Dendrobium catenatum]|uniref:Ankyrin repeat-containing protein n=1 Tax=Dendrobium catenatum TaxID=906689 RepID=A0A2I0XJB3_9ASPA|nr:Ankyrin repeat-containing protein [Dendrobium catenatum]